MKRLTALILALLGLIAPTISPARADVSPSVMILVNKENSLPSDYVPDDLVQCDVKFTSGVDYSRRQMRREAAEALKELFDGAAEAGIELLGVSGYRSYWTQNELYQTGLSLRGYDHVSIYVAKPGCSEHQTGLAMDLGVSGCRDLTERFADTDAYKWLRKHAHEYGFIIRYPRGGTAETGYAFEPWHVRYIGDAAADVYKSGKTFEAWYEEKLRGTTLKTEYVLLPAQVEEG